jgi:hypothetical protein
VTSTSIAVDDIRPAPPTACSNCGHDRVDTFCARCGEKQPHHHDVTVGHFFHELLHEILHVDSKLFRTMRVLITRPGELTADYFAGRKTRYITPLRLFLTLFALQLVVYTIYKPVALYSMANVAKISASPDTMKNFGRLAAKKHMTTEQLIEKIDEKWQHNLSLLQLFMILGAALVLKVLYRGKRQYGEHLVFSAHYLTFSYVYAIAIWPLYWLIGLNFGPLMIAVMVVNMTLSAVYICIAIRRYYGQSLEKSIAKGILAWIGVFVVNALVMQIAAVTAVIQVAKLKV